MSVTTFSQIAQTAGLSGRELVCISVPQYGPFGDVVAYTTAVTTTNDIANLYAPPSLAAPTMRQLFQALSANGQYLTAYEALPADPTDTYNIAWNRANVMPINDPFISGFLQPTLGLSDGQLLALYQLAATYPQ